MGGAIFGAIGGALAASGKRKSNDPDWDRDKYKDPRVRDEEEKQRKYDWEIESRKVYSIRTIKRPFGEGIEISKFDPYEQVKCKKGLIARIFPSKENSQGDGDSYTSVIYKYPFENNSENHSLFKELTDRLNEKQSKKINNKLILSNQGLEEKLDNEIVIRINKKDKKKFPVEAYQFVDGWGHLIGYPSDVIEFFAGALTFAAGFAGSIFALIPGYNPISSLVAYLPTTAAGIAMLADSHQSNEWRGGFAEKPGLAHRLGHKIGIKLATINFEERLRKEDYALNKFLSSDKTVVESPYDPYGPLGAVDAVTSFGYDQNSQQYHHRNELHEALTKMFEFTPYQKGFSITSNHINKITALRFVEYLLTGKSSIQREKEDHYPDRYRDLDKKHNTLCKNGIHNQKIDDDFGKDDYDERMEAMLIYQPSGSQEFKIKEGKVSVGQGSGILKAGIKVGGDIIRGSGETELNLDKNVALEFENLGSASIQVIGGSLKDEVYMANNITKPKHKLKVTQCSGDVKVTYSH